MLWKWEYSRLLSANPAARNQEVCRDKIEHWPTNIILCFKQNLLSCASSIVSIQSLNIYTFYAQGGDMLCGDSSLWERPIKGQPEAALEQADHLQASGLPAHAMPPRHRYYLSFYSTLASLTTLTHMPDPSGLAWVSQSCVFAQLILSPTFHVYGI